MGLSSGCGTKIKLRRRSDALEVTSAIQSVEKIISNQLVPDLLVSQCTDESKFEPNVLGLDKRQHHPGSVHHVSMRKYQE